MQPYCHDLTCDMSTRISVIMSCSLYLQQENEEIVDKLKQEIKSLESKVKNLHTEVQDVSIYSFNIYFYHTSPQYIAQHSIWTISTPLYFIFLNFYFFKISLLKYMICNPKIE